MEDFVYDPIKGQEALGKLMDMLNALSEDELDALNVDLQDASLVALEIAKLCTDPAIRGDFEQLPEKFFDIKYLDNLADLGWCAWHAQSQFMTASTTSRTAKLEVELIERSSRRRNRMFKVAKYYLGDDPTDGPEIIAIRAGIGYKDTANDLVRLARLYKLRKDRLKRDPENYRDDDEQEALKDSAEILSKLRASGSEAEKWAGTKARAWTLLHKSYSEVVAAGQFMYRNDPLKKKFPSLFTALRQLV